MLDGCWDDCSGRTTNKAYASDSIFHVEERLAESLLQSLAGSPLSTVIDRPYFPLDAIITDAWESGETGTNMALEIPTSAFTDTK